MNSQQAGLKMRPISIFGLLLSFTASSVFAQMGGRPPETIYKTDWNERLNPNVGLKAHNDGLLDDKIDFSTGRLSFETVDVSLPGNSALPVEIRRRRNPSQANYNEDQLNLYAYVGNDPLNRTDPSGREIKLSGAEDAQRKFLEQMSRATGLKLAIKNGKIVQTGRRDKSVGNAHAASVVRGAINSKKSVSLEVVDGDRNVRFVDEFAMRKVDVSDLSALFGKSDKLGAAFLTHVISEQFYAAKHGLTARDSDGYPRSHSQALRDEAKVMGAKTRTESYVFGSNPSVTLEYRDRSGDVVDSYEIKRDSNGKPIP